MSQIVIRSTEPDDARAVREIYAQTNAYTGTLQLPYPSNKLWEDRLGGMPNNIYSFVALIDNRIVGNLGLEVFAKERRRHAGQIGMGVHDDYLQQGVGSALMSALIDLTDNWLNLQRIELTVYTDNDAAIALYKKFDFKVEGEIPMYAFRNGHYVDAYLMGRIKRA